MFETFKTFLLGDADANCEDLEVMVVEKVLWLMRSTLTLLFVFVSVKNYEEAHLLIQFYKKNYRIEDFDISIYNNFSPSKDRFQLVFVRRGIH